MLTEFMQDNAAFIFGLWLGGALFQTVGLLSQQVRAGTWTPLSPPLLLTLLIIFWPYVLYSMITLALDERRQKRLAPFKRR